MRGHLLPLKMLNKHMWLVMVGLIVILGFFMVFLQLSTSSDGNPMNTRYSSWIELGKALAHKNIPALHPNLEFYKPPKSPPEFTGQANLHVFEDWCGSSIQQLRRNLHFPLYPHVRTTISKLAVTPQWTNYGLRIFGYLQPTTEGEYQFAVSSDDNAEFWLSKDHSVEKLSLMCRVGPTGKQWTAPGEFGKFQDQVSIRVRLSPAVKYYFELLHKQDDAGTDHVEVAWRLAELGSQFTVIDSRFLSLFSNDTGDSLGDTSQIPVSEASFYSEGFEQHPADMLKPDRRDDFYKVPLISKNRIRNVLPTCSYKPSYLVEGYPLQRYQGLQFVHLTYVYPNDYTRLTHMEKDNQCIYQENMRGSNRFAYKRYMKMDQPEQKPSIQPGMLEDYNPSDFHYETQEKESENRGDMPRKDSLRHERKLLSLISKGGQGIPERSKAGLHKISDFRRPQNWTGSSLNITVSVSDAQYRDTFDVQDKIIPDVGNASTTLTLNVSQPDTRNSSQVQRPRAALDRYRDRRKQPVQQRVKDNQNNLGERAGGKTNISPFSKSTAKAITQNKVKLRNEQGQIYQKEQITQTVMPNKKSKLKVKTIDSGPYEPIQQVKKWTKLPKVEMHEYRREERAEAKLDNERNLGLNLNDGKIQNLATYKTVNPVLQSAKEEVQKPETINFMQWGRFDPRVNRQDLKLHPVEEQNNEIAIPVPQLQQEEGQKPQSIDIDRLGRFDPRVKRPELEQVEEQKHVVDNPSDEVRPENAQYEDYPQEEKEEEEEEDMEYPLIYEQPVNWNQTFDFGQTDFQIIRPDSIDLQCNTSGNLLLREREVVGVVAAFMRKLNQKYRGMYQLQNIINVEKRRDYLQGSRYFLELELKDRYGHIQRFAQYVYAPEWQGNFSEDDEQKREMKNMMWGSYRRLLGAKWEPDLCWPSGLNWNPQATVHFIVPIKNQARWVQKFIRDMETLYQATLDSRFNVIIVDFNSTDFDVEAALRQSHVPSYQYVKLLGNFERSAGLQVGIELVKNPHSILFLCDLHMHFPPSIIDSMRTHCVEGKMVFAPIVMRLNCGATPRWPEGYWEVNGFGLLGIYKSDLDRIGGMNTQEFKERWGGEDWELLDRIVQAGLEVERVAMRNFYHHYHSKRGMWNRRQAQNWR